MFDIGFSELVVIGLVALIVIGPERLPRVARTVGALLGRFQRYVNDVKSEVRREMEIEDLKKFQSQLTDHVREVEQTIHKGLDAVEDEARGVMAEAAMNEPQQAVAAAASAPAESLPESPLAEAEALAAPPAQDATKPGQA